MLGIALGPGYEVGESLSATAARPAGGLRADYGFGAPVSTNTELGRHMSTFETRVRQDMDEIYTRLAHAYTRHQMDTEARLSREAWRRSIDASNLACGEVMSLHTTVLGQIDAVITGTCDHATGTCGSTTGAGYRTAGTAGTRWRSCIARAARGGWYQFID
ncbi:hypothetical protein Tco_0076260 [Tanacetum coccineum]